MFFNPDKWQSDESELDECYHQTIEWLYDNISFYDDEEDEDEG